MMEWFMRRNTSAHVIRCILLLHISSSFIWVGRATSWLCTHLFAYLTRANDSTSGKGRNQKKDWDDRNVWLQFINHNFLYASTLMIRNWKGILVVIRTILKDIKLYSISEAIIKPLDSVQSIYMRYQLPLVMNFEMADIILLSNR